jgi:hypothetical protein
MRGRKEAFRKRTTLVDRRALKLIRWGQKNMYRVLYEPLEAHLKELHQIQKKIGLLQRPGTPISELKRLEELKAKRTMLMEAIRFGKKALEIQERQESK